MSAAMARYQHIAFGFSALAIGLLASCFKPVLESATPDRQYSIAVEEACGFPDCGVRVTSESHGWKSTLAQETDCSMLLASVVWNEERTRAGVLVGNTYCRNIYLTYDFTAKTVLPGAEMEALHGANLLRQFGLPSGQSRYSSRALVDWALDASLDGDKKFRIFRAKRREGQAGSGVP